MAVVTKSMLQLTSRMGRDQISLSREAAKTGGRIEIAWLKDGVLKVQSAIPLDQDPSRPADAILKGVFTPDGDEPLQVLLRGPGHLELARRLHAVEYVPGRARAELRLRNVRVLRAWPSELPASPIAAEVVE